MTKVEVEEYVISNMRKSLDYLVGLSGIEQGELLGGASELRLSAFMFHRMSYVELLEWLWTAT